ncbi:MAG: MMPL family transporter [Verrucomicrobiota bacterium]
MNKIFVYCYDHARGILLFIALLTCFFAWRAVDVGIDVGQENLYPKDTELYRRYLETKQTFGSDMVAVVYIRDSDLFNLEKMTRLRELFDEVSELEGVERSEGLFTINNIRNDDGALDTQPLLDYIPDTQEELTARQQYALQNPIIFKNYISADGNATLITLYLNKVEKDLKFDRKFHNQLDGILKKYQGDFHEAFQLGSPFVHTTMGNYLFGDQIFLVPISVFILVLFIGYSFGSLRIALLPLANAFVSSIWMVGIMQMLGYTVNFLTYTIPSIMIVIGSAEDIHMVASFFEEKHEGKRLREAMARVGHKLGLILIFTSATTIFGFASNGITNIPIMKEFSFAAGIGMTCNFLATITMIPALLRLMGSKFEPREGDHKEKQSLASKASHHLSRFMTRQIVHYPLRVLLCVALVSVPFILFGLKIQVNNDLLSFFRPSSPIVTRNNVLHENLVGSRMVYVNIVREPGDFQRASNVQSLADIAQYLRNLGAFDSVQSLSDYVRLVHREMNESQPSCHVVPSKDDLISQYLLLFTRKDLERYVSADYAQANIVIRHNINSSTQLNALLEKINTDLAGGRFGHFKFNVTGSDVLISTAVEEISKGQATTVITDFLVVFLLMSFMFVSFKAGAVALVPNVIPIVIVYGLMGMFHIPLNIGTAMIAAIAIGIAVDDTIHFMLTYQGNVKQLNDAEKALQKTLNDETLPVVISSLALAGGFYVLAFSSFVPVAQFGILSGTCMLTAVVTDLLVTPILLSTVRIVTLWDIMGVHYREKLIAHSPLLKGFTRWQIRRLFALCHLIEHSEGARILREGESGEQMYLVVDGELSVRKNSRQIAELKPGSIFGEMALIGKTTRVADVIAVSDVKLLVLDWKALEQIQHFAPYLSSRLFLNLSRVLVSRLADMVQSPYSVKEIFSVY